MIGSFGATTVGTRGGHWPRSIGKPWLGSQGGRAAVGGQAGNHPVPGGAPGCYIPQPP
ncbi:hypothetical protein DB31_4934 [Hyalangium minutum]|uniref:Uncharacterized protein n=1 Tax=Hyalangium minutum TaxID=394096 RepID=A0A085WQC9_9BACT|nr:hypothetical protein DB31_4934 [Hyalangium minutum]